MYDTSRFNENEKYQRKVIIDESYNRPIYGQCNGSHVFIDENNIATIYGETYLIINGNIEKICENNQKFVIVDSISKHI